MTPFDKNSETTVHPPLAPAVDSAIYVDELFVFESRRRQARDAGQANDHRWCHMWSEDVEALHALAGNLGMQREWFQNKPGFPYYDLPPARRVAALSLGAMECSLKDWLRARRAKKRPEKTDLKMKPASNA
jgi:hypothetical protein